MNAQVNPSSNFVQTVVHGTARMIDVQMSVTRSLLETQAKIAALFGAPDLSRNFTENGHAHSIEQGIGQAVDYNQRVLGALVDLQTQWIKFVQQQAEQLGERVREDMQETGSRVEEGITEAVELAKRAVPTEEKPFGSQQVRGGEQQGRTGDQQARSGDLQARSGEQKDRPAGSEQKDPPQPRQQSRA